jgi:DUF917 family protein
MSHNHYDYWMVTPDDVESIALGAGILGTGGGGNPYLGKIRLWEVMKRGQQPKVIPPDQVPDDARISTV